jgi:hypothetical protein
MIFRIFCSGAANASYEVHTASPMRHCYLSFPVFPDVLYMFTPARSSNPGIVVIRNRKAANDRVAI